MLKYTAMVLSFKNCEWKAMLKVDDFEADFLFRLTTSIVSAG